MTAQEHKPLHLQEADASQSISSDDGDKEYEKEGEMTSCLSSVLAMPSLYEEVTDFGDACSQDDTASSSSLSSYLSTDETDDDIELGSCCHPKRVTWSPTIVTETRYRLKTSPEDKELLHYTAADMIHFRQQYKMQLRAALKMKRDREAQQRKQDTSTERPTSFQNPISGMINMMSSYLSKSSPSSSSSSTNISSNSAAKRSLETTLLVDTLYLF